MALALERGSQMQAPLGRAVIGGLVMSTFATLLVVPSIFALVIGSRKARTPSIYPNDPESPHYDPLVFAEEDATGKAVRPLDPETVSPHPNNHEDSHASDGVQAPGRTPSALPVETPLPGDP
jgi:hypothetical protein